MDNQKTDHFEGIRFVENYSGLDFDDVDIVANNKLDAWVKLRKVKRNWKFVDITHINGKRILKNV